MYTWIYDACVLMQQFTNELIHSKLFHLTKLKLIFVGYNASYMYASAHSLLANALQLI